LRGRFAGILGISACFLRFSAQIFLFSAKLEKDVRKIQPQNDKIWDKKPEKGLKVSEFSHILRGKKGLKVIKDVEYVIFWVEFGLFYVEFVIF